ncbi:uncharacterized protein LOC107885253 [Acyrthosiphon pisum]|uniref:Uncharacterized protein n=1 Tax=Acyrthosiphon pisum TaxID=7029 RepID=A0A8R2HBU6_ACYPI|nr:uncharacterized protein LOC107885253 [Acyrthosiphon pisum]|eukprot:XP_016664341.1 PREDICTED: uncharacterized protein LOC107885253 [Acyrthosiphon pisum]
MEICPDLEVGSLFSDYVLNTYIEDDSLFPPILWAQVPLLNPRTTNGAESFHRTYNGQFYSTHPPTHAVISVLKETQTQTVAIINSIENNITKTMASKDYNRIVSTINLYKEFEQNKDIIRYLKLTGNKYLGKKY